MAYLGSYQLDTLLEEAYVISDVDEYHQNYSVIFDVIKFAIAESTAYRKIQPYQQNKQGPTAYQTLKVWYEGQGSDNTLATRAWSRMQGLFFSPNSSHSMES